MIDQTRKFSGMIESFECDLSLAADPWGGHRLVDLQRRLDKGQDDEALREDIELLKELSWGLRTGKLKIVEIEDICSEYDIGDLNPRRNPYFNK